MVPSIPIFRPFRCFSRPTDWTSRPGTAIALGVGAAVVFAVLIYVTGVVVAAQTGGTVTVDNPDHPGEGICENRPANFPEPTGCDEPETVERDVGNLLLEAFDTVAVVAFVGYLFAWLFGAGVLHLGAWLAGGDGTISDTYAIGAWGGVATLVTSIPGIALLGAAFLSVDFAGAAGQEAMVEAMRTEVRSLGPLIAGLGLLGSTWQAVLWYAGLVGLHDLDDDRALFLTGVLWLLSVLGSLSN